MNRSTEHHRCACRNRAMPTFGDFDMKQQIYRLLEQQKIPGRGLSTALRQMRENSSALVPRDLTDPVQRMARFHYLI